MKPLFRLALRRSRDRELDEELAFHLEMRARELMAKGLSPEAARAEARRQFGDLEDARRYCHQVDTRLERRLRHREVLSELRQDLGFAVRALRRAPAYTLVAALTLALGIGANTAIFSVVRGILLRPLPFPAPDRLVMLASSFNGTPTTSSPANVVDWQNQNKSFAALSPLESHPAVLTGSGEPERLRGFDVGADFFAILGATPVAGRLGFTKEEASWRGPKAVILHESLWRTRFGADPNVVGRTITLDGVRHQVVGVAPAAQAWPSNAVLWFPWSFDPAQLAESRGSVYLNVVGRLKPEVTLEAARTDLGAITERLARDYPDDNPGLRAVLIPLHEWITGDLTQPLYILLGGVGFVLLIACANVANLALIRGVARQSELAVRAALGAGRGRLIRQLVTESAVLALAGAGLGILVARLGMNLLLQAAPSSMPRLNAVHLDGMVLGFTLFIALLTALGFGLLPARLVVRPDLAKTLREGGRGVQRAAGNRARRALVVAEVALAVMLLAGAGLLIRSFDKLTRVDPGFRPDHSVAFALSLPEGRYPEGEAQAAFVRALLIRVGALPGVQSTGAAFGMPLTGLAFVINFEVAGRPPLKPAEQPSAEIRIATPGYFAAMGIPILKGRGFTESDRAGMPRAILITQAAAQKFFPNEEPIGKHLRIGWRRDSVQLEGDVVGVLGDLKLQSLREESAPQFWLAYEQWPIGSFNVVMHTNRAEDAMVNEARGVVHELDPDLAVSQVRTLEAVLAESVAQPRFYMLLLSVFAGVAILLSAIGIYGVIAYVAGQRVREIGIRMALGASRGRVVRMIVREGTWLTLTGVVAGVLGAAGLSRVLRALLFQVSTTDPLTYLGVVGLLGVVALVASGIPALAAAKVDPAMTMRAE